MSRTTFKTTKDERRTKAPTMSKEAWLPSQRRTGAEQAIWSDSADGHRYPPAAAALDDQIASFDVTLSGVATDFLVRQFPSRVCAQSLEPQPSPVKCPDCPCWPRPQAPKARDEPHPKSPGVCLLE